PPARHEVAAWFRDQAPEEIVFSRPVEAATPDKLRFRRSRVAAVHGGGGSKPAVSFIKLCTLAPDERGVLLWCNMWSGEGCASAIPSPDSASRLLGLLANPAHAEPCDLDGDGRVDLVVADLGGFKPADHDNGKVVWLQQMADGGWQPRVIQAGLGRVADVQV